MAERWDCHQHRDEMFTSDARTVCHPEKGQLCYWLDQYHGDHVCRTYHPIEFKTEAFAEKWIDSGFIAELQEGMSILAVGFSCVTIQQIPNFSDYMESL